MTDFFVRLILGILERLPVWLKPSSSDGVGSGKLETKLRSKLKKENW